MPTTITIKAGIEFATIGNGNDKLTESHFNNIAFHHNHYWIVFARHAPTSYPHW